MVSGWSHRSYSGGATLWIRKIIGASGVGIPRFVEVAVGGGGGFQRPELYDFQPFFHEKIIFF